MTEEDGRQLDLLGVFHYVVAAMAGLCSLTPVLHLAMGLAMLSGEFPGRGGPDFPREFGWFFVILPSAIILLGLAFSGCLAWAGTCLRRRRRHTFCVVMAALACCWMPFGTVLGIFTLVVLLRSGVKEAFLATGS